MVQEMMWETDKDLQKVRGFVEGFTQGFYKNFTYSLDSQCMGKTTVRYLYYLREDLEHFDYMLVSEIIGLVYNLYFMFDFHCKVEQILNDLSEWCFSHNCHPEQLVKNEMGNVFQVTGALNSLAAVVYDPEPDSDAHSLWFDRFSQIGLSVGKMVRYTLMFDPSAPRDDIDD